jgi:hypothetical protein
MSRMRANYWTAKQTIRSRLGKKEDDHLVASDAELDSKLAVFYSLKDTCDAMILCIENYQDAICGWVSFDHIGCIFTELSQEENTLGRFLKHSGKADATQAGKMMAAVGRAGTYTARLFFIAQVDDLSFVYLGSTTFGSARAARATVR